MATRKAPTSARSRRAIHKIRTKRGGERCSIDTMGSPSITADDRGYREDPSELQDMFRTARKWRKDNWFVGSILALKATCISFGQTFSAAEKKDKKAIEAWLAEKDVTDRYTNHMTAAKYVRSA